MQTRTARHKRSNRLSKRLVPTPHHPAALERVAAGTDKVEILLERCEKLNHQLNDRTFQLKTALDNVEKYKTELQQFANIVSHDLRTPLRAISGFSHFLQQEYHDDLDDIASGYIERVVDASARLQQMINGLMLFSRIESRSAPFGLVDLNEIVKEARTSVQERIVEAEVEVTCEKLPVVWGDATQLTSLFVSLIENGLKFNESVLPAIHIDVEQDHSSWLVSVQDNGIGIAKDRHECIFDIFRRLNLPEKYDGVGVGLAVCRRIIERHSGRIWIDSNAGNGCTFFLSLPLA